MNKRQDFVPDSGNLSFDSTLVPGDSNINDVGSKVPDKLIRLTIPDDGSGGFSGSGVGSGVVSPSNDIKDSDQTAPLLHINDRPVYPRDVPIWSPDTSKTPEENLQSLMSFIGNLLRPGSVWGSYNTSALDYMNTLNAMFYSLDAFDFLPFTDSATMITLAEKITDVAWKFVDSQYSSALQYQSWYLQQDYNSPLNQINRLAEAGLNSAFAIGGLSSGNAQQMANVGHVESVPTSQAGNVQAQIDSQKSGLFGTLFSAIASMVPAIGGAAASLVQAHCTKMMTPVEIAKMGADITMSAANEEFLRATADQAKVNSALNIFSQEQLYSRNLLDNASIDVDSSKAAYETAFFNSDFTVEQEETQWQTNVVTKSGERKTVTMSTDDVEKAIENGGQTTDGNYIEGYQSWNVNARLDASQKFKAGIPGFGSGEGKVQGSIGGGFESGSKHGESFSSSNFAKSSLGDRHSEGSYSDDGSSFTIGDSKFISVTTRRRVPLPQHAAHIEDLYNRYQRAVDKLHTLSASQRAYLDRMSDELTRGLSSLSASTTKSLMKYQIDNMINKKPLSLVGD